MNQRWSSGRRRPHSQSNRFLLFGAIAGLGIIGYGLLVKLPGGDSEFGDVAWVSLVVPVVLYVVWWLWSPGLTTDQAEVFQDVFDQVQPNVDVTPATSPDAFKVRREEPSLEQRQQYLESIRQPPLANPERPAAFRHSAE
jgi:hypothetical protein